MKKKKRNGLKRHQKKTLENIIQKFTSASCCEAW
jgi:hypothetical protein